VGRVPFTKLEGLGNDFIVLDGGSRLLTPMAAAHLCDRRRGIGADGVLTLLPARHPEATRRFHVYNADGSVAEMCGNGLRCVARFVGGGQVVFDTDAGLRRTRLMDDGRIEADLAEATLLGERISVKLGERSWAGTGISMGNPHLVLDPFEEGADLLAMAQVYGPLLERHAHFPNRCNVGFLAPAADGVFRLVVFERGSGITLACGTGAGAAAVALVRAGRAQSPITLELPGGRLEVMVEGDPTAQVPVGVGLGQVRQRGPAVTVFAGVVELGDDQWL
jgi:diaminopimelate epimerase